MKLLVIDSKNASEIYNEAGPELKKKIAETFNINQDITDRVKTFEDACEVLGTSADEVNSTLLGNLPDEVAYKKLKIVAQALNEGWTPNWNDNDERKWRPWFWLDAPGFRFDGSGYGYSGTYSAGGSRLCFKSEKLSNYAAKQFIDLYRDSFN